MSFKQKVDNYLEEQRRTKEAEKKAQKEKRLKEETEKKAIFNKKVIEYLKKSAPLIEALNKTPIQQWLEEIKKEFSLLQSADIYLIPNCGMNYIPQNLSADIGLTKIRKETKSYLKGPGDHDYWEDYEEVYETLIGIGAIFDDDQNILFYSFSKDDNWNLELVKENICLANDLECNQKIEKALVKELLKFA